MGTDLDPQPTRYLDPPTRESGCQIKRDRHSTMASSRVSDCPVDPNRLAERGRRERRLAASAEKPHHPIALEPPVDRHQQYWAEIRAAFPDRVAKNEVELGRRSLSLVGISDGRASSSHESQTIPVKRRNDHSGDWRAMCQAQDRQYHEVFQVSQLDWGPKTFPSPGQ